MPIRRRQKKRNDEPRQKQEQRHAVIDPLVNPGSPPRRHQTRSKANPTRTHHRMVFLAQSSSGGRSTRSLQIKKATVMLGVRCQSFVPIGTARQQDRSTDVLPKSDTKRKLGPVMGLSLPSLPAVV